MLVREGPALSTLECVFSMFLLIPRLNSSDFPTFCLLLLFYNAMKVSSMGFRRTNKHSTVLEMLLSQYGCHYIRSRFRRCRTHARRQG